MYTHVEGGGRRVVAAAQDQARRLGHGFIGCEHLLYGLACDDGRVGELLRQSGATPERCEAEFVRLVGARRETRPVIRPSARPGTRNGPDVSDRSGRSDRSDRSQSRARPGSGAESDAASDARSDASYDAASDPGLGLDPESASGPAAAADPLDGAALGSLGIDLDAVRERVEAVFGPGALAAAAVRPYRSRRLSWAKLRRPSATSPRPSLGSGPGSRFRPRSRPGSRSGLRMQSAPESWSPSRLTPGHLPLTRRAAACLKRALAHADSARTGRLGADDVALVLLAMENDIPRRVLAAIGVSASRLRAEILAPDRA